jgi:hypothetical protein
MVYYSTAFEEDIQKIFVGLLTWKKYNLSLEFCYAYIDGIELQCKSLDLNSYHAKTTYKSHKKYGDYVYRYKRNHNTCWYIIYNMDSFYNVYIERITNNHITL